MRLRICDCGGHHQFDEGGEFTLCPVASTHWFEVTIRRDGYRDYRSVQFRIQNKAGWVVSGREGEDFSDFAIYLKVRSLAVACDKDVFVRFANPDEDRALIALFRLNSWPSEWMAEGAVADNPRVISITSAEDIDRFLGRESDAAQVSG